MARLRWPKSIHMQVESVFKSICAIGKDKKTAPKGHIRSIGTWGAYRAEAHRFAHFLSQNGINDLRDTIKIQSVVSKYLSRKLQVARMNNASYQTQKSRSSALASLERSFNNFFESRDRTLKLDFSAARKEYLALSKAYLNPKIVYSNGSRAYPQPEKLVSYIQDKTHALQATLQYQGGLRAEGVGAPSGKIYNPLTQKNLRGIVTDPVTKVSVGAIRVREKGGKWTTHYIPKTTYQQLVNHINQYGKLESKYADYRESVITAAKRSGQFSQGRGTHGLKTAFAHHRYRQCIERGFSHERALQTTALELAHNRFDITVRYLKG